MFSARSSLLLMVAKCTAWTDRSDQCKPRFGDWPTMALMSWDDIWLCITSWYL